MKETSSNLGMEISKFVSCKYVVTGDMWDLSIHVKNKRVCGAFVNSMS